MKYKQRFKDEFIANFNGESFIYKEDLFIIHGTTGVDFENNRVQIRDDIHIKHSGANGKVLTFEKMMDMWDGLNDTLLSIISKRKLAHKRDL